MEYSVIIERTDDPSLAKDFYYAHVPCLDLTTHGLGIEGAKNAAYDLIKLWIQEKIANGESIPVETEVHFSKIEISDALLSS